MNISHEIDSSGTQLQVDVTCSAFTSDLLSVSGQKIIQEWMYHFIIEIYCHIIVPQNFEDKIESLLMNEKAMERSVPFTSSFMTQYNILGKTAINDIASLLDNDKYKQFNLKRVSKWDSESPREVKKEKQFFDSQFKKGEIPENLLDNEKLTHTDIKTFSLIKPRLWDKASWCGTGFWS